MTANYGCPSCDGRLRTKVRRLMYACRRCGEVVVEIPEQSPSKGWRGVARDMCASEGVSHR